jgi:hypothetical protein
MTEPTRRTRPKPGWADVPDMVPPHPLHRETPALVAITAILDHLSTGQCARLMGYLAERYAVAAPETVLPVRAGDVP